LENKILNHSKIKETHTTIKQLALNCPHHHHSPTRMAVTL